MTRLQLEILSSCTPHFIPLLEKGVGLAVTTGASLRDLLCHQLGLSDAYLNQRIQTLFLNARPVDDVDRTLVTDGDTLALSSAMPGLLGATMRKGGRYAAFRKSISQQTDTTGRSEQAGQITIKLFNMVAREIGSHVLSTGVQIDGGDLYNVVKQFSGKLSENIQKMVVDGQETTPEMASFQSLSTNRVSLVVTVEEG